MPAAEWIINMLKSSQENPHTLLICYMKCPEYANLCKWRLYQQLPATEGEWPWVIANGHRDPSLGGALF